MTEEIKDECICKSKCFRDVVKIALGSFIGAYLALSLFSAIHKPPMPCPFHPMMDRVMMYNGGFHHKMHFDKYNKFNPENFKNMPDKLQQVEHKE